MRPLSKTLLRLTVETSAFHREADAAWSDLVAPGRSLSRLDYVQHLMQRYGFDAPLEAAVAYTPLIDRFIDLQPRFRAGLIAQDLLRLGASADSLTSVGQCMIAPFANAVEAFGWLYVHQRCTATFDAFRSELVARLPEVTDATSYLCSPSENLWDHFGEALDHLARSRVYADRIIQAAYDAFRALIQWHNRAASASRDSLLRDRQREREGRA